MPLVAQSWTPHGLTSWKILQINSPDSIYQIQATLEFETSEAIQKAMSSEGTPKVMADIKNFTTSEPVIIAGSVVVRTSVAVRVESDADSSRSAHLRLGFLCRLLV
nr:hypothetical protein CFP56_58171 [Quercus suber]